MELLIVLAIFLVLDLLALCFGVDSRVQDPADDRGWWPDTRV